MLKLNVLTKTVLCILISCFYSTAFAHSSYKVMANQDGSDHEIQIKAEQGDKHAQAFLCEISAQMQSHDNSLTNKMLYWCEKSAEQGIEKSQYRMGEFYYRGNGVKQDFEKARHWLEQSAQQGYAHAQLNLGVMYYQGDGVPVDYKQAVYWYKKSAQQNHPTAQLYLGNRYFKGQGVIKSTKKAKYWYKKACDNHVETACEYLKEFSIK